MVNSLNAAEIKCVGCRDFPMSWTKAVTGRINKAGNVTKSRKSRCFGVEFVGPKILALYILS